MIPPTGSISERVLGRSALCWVLDCIAQLLEVASLVLQRSISKLIQLVPLPHKRTNLGSVQTDREEEYYKRYSTSLASMHTQTCNTAIFLFLSLRSSGGRAITRLVNNLRFCS